MSSQPNSQMPSVRPNPTVHPEPITRRLSPTAYCPAPPRHSHSSSLHKKPLPASPNRTGSPRRPVKPAPPDPPSPLTAHCSLLCPRSSPLPPIPKATPPRHLPRPRPPCSQLAPRRATTPHSAHAPKSAKMHPAPPQEFFGKELIYMSAHSTRPAYSSEHIKFLACTWHGIRYRRALSDANEILCRTKAHPDRRIAAGRDVHELNGC